MDALARLLALPAAEREKRGVVYTPREIFQQPVSWRRTYQKFSQLLPSLQEFLIHPGLIGNEKAPLTVFLVGAGTSDYIGRSLAALLQREWQCEVQAVPSTDLLTNLEEHIVPGRSYLWISFSRSGDSSEGVAVLSAALDRYPEIRHLIVTCNERGQMATSFNDRRNVFRIVLDDEVNDRGLAMTSSFSNMLVVGQALAHLRDLKTYGALLEDLATGSSNILPAAADMCERHVGQGFSRVCFLGTGALKGVAIESALKVLELTNGQVMSFAESFLGLRHGPLSAIDAETLIVSFLSGDERRRAFELDLLKEISDKRITAKCLTVSPTTMLEGRSPGSEENTILLGLTTSIIDLYRPPVDVLIGQLLGLFASLREGLKPDTPSPQDAINRVVSHLTIH